MPAFPALPALPALPAFPATTGALPYAAPEASPALTSIAGPTLWWVTIAAVVALLALDFVITRRPHEVTMREALAWSAFYIAIPVGFGVWIWTTHGNQTGLEYYTGYLVEKSLSVDNLFIFLLLLGAFAVPRELQQRVLLIGVAGALVLRGIFIALGAGLIATFSWTFLIFGAVLLATAVKVGRDALRSRIDAFRTDVGSRALTAWLLGFLGLVALGAASPARADELEDFQAARAASSTSSSPASGRP